MPTFSVELNVTVQTKKRGFMGDSTKDKTYTKVITVIAEDSEHAEELALDRVKVQTPGYSLVNVHVSKCEEKDESLKEVTVTVTGKVWFQSASTKGFRDVSLDYVYNKGEGMTDKMLKDHAESRFRMEVQEMEEFHYVEYIVCTIVCEGVEQYVQI